MYDVTAIGEMLIDFVQTGKNEYGYPTLAANPGGAPGNYICALSRFGKRTRMIGKVGKDTFGALLKTTLDERGVDTSALIEDNSVFTTLAFVTLAENGDRSFAFSRKPGADTCLRSDELPGDLCDTRILHFGTLSLTDEPSRSATLAAVRRAKDAGVTISLDPNLRLSLWNSEDAARKATLMAIPFADVIKLSEEELAFLFGPIPEDEGLKKLHLMGPKLIFLTLGSKGCRYSLEGRATGYTPAVEAAVTDTTGAGDIFGGACAYGFLNCGTPLSALSKEQLDGIVLFANRAAGLSTEKHGGIPSIPSLEEISARYGDDR